MRLNIGSGQRKFATPWINVDAQARWEPDVVADGGEYLRTLAPGSADLIVIHHVLEHHGCGEADGLLRECHRVLRPGGSLLVFVPDLWKLARMWLEGRMETQVYMTNLYGAFMGDPADRHKFGYDWSSLRMTLRATGFERTLRFDHREIPGADIARDDRWILAIEGVR